MHVPHVASPIICRSCAQVMLKGMSSAGKGPKLCITKLYGISVGSSLTYQLVGECKIGNVVD